MYVRKSDLARAETSANAEENCRRRGGKGGGCSPRGYGSSEPKRTAPSERQGNSRPRRAEPGFAKSLDTPAPWLRETAAWSFLTEVQRWWRLPRRHEGFGDIGPTERLWEIIVWIKLGD